MVSLDLYDKKDHDNARLEFEQATSIDPRDATSHNALGIVYRELGRLGAIPFVFAQVTAS
jgi:Flp pilus assembly protein TadD